MTNDREPWAWRKSSYSGGQGNCVEVAANRPGVVAVRDSKDPAGPVLCVSAESWRAFARDMARASAQP